MSRPTLARRQFGHAMRRLRESMKLSLREAEPLVGFSRQKLAGIEVGDRATSINDAKAMCEAYGATNEQRLQLLALRAAGNERGWWEGHGAGLPAKGRLFIEMEQESRALHCVETAFIPGLAQTTAYTRAMFQEDPFYSVETVDEVLAVRAHRQDAVWGRDPLPEARFVLAEGALSVLDQHPEIKDDQIIRLRELSSLPTVDIRIVRRLHAAMSGAFTILYPGPPGEEDPPVVYLESLDGCRYIESDVVSTFERAFSKVFESAQPIEEYLE